MELNFANISKSEGIKERFDITEPLKEGRIKFCGECLNIADPVTVKGSAVNYDGKISADLSITAKVERTCSRCLAKFTEEVQTDSRYVFVRDIKDDKEDYYVYDGESADITDLVIGDIVTRLSMKPLCDDNCEGLCSICGINRNKSKCQCKREDIDHRMEVLSKLLDRE